MTWGYKTGGKDFVRGFGPRRQLHRGPAKETHKTRRDLLNYYADHLPDRYSTCSKRAARSPRWSSATNTRVRRDPRLADLHDLVANPEEAATVDDGRECSMPYLPISTLVRAASSSVRQRPRRMT